jgi:hydrogenase maturation protease
VVEVERAPVLVIGVGNELRGDDAAGIEVARRLRESGRAGGVDVEDEQSDPTALIERWRGRAAVVLIDAVPGDAPGAVHRFDASSGPLPKKRWGSSSTHAVGLEETIVLARTLGQLPARVIVYAIEGRRFGAGDDLSDTFAEALPALAGRVLSEALELTNAAGSD